MSLTELRRTLRQLVWPNGTVVSISVVAIASGLFDHLIASGADYAAVAVIAAGLLTAWRFHAVRSMAGLLLFAATALAFSNSNSGAQLAPQTHALFPALTLLLPLNVAALLLVEEFTLALQPLTYWLGLMAAQTAMLALTCSGNASVFWRWLINRPSWWPPMAVGPIVAAAFVVVTVVLLFKFAKDRRPLDAGLAWSMLPSLLACLSTGQTRTAYLAAAAVAITISITETSYQLAYEDELTRLPGRRAFNQTIAALDDEYSIAMVDVDHFKKFNDTYGHDVGDQVLRMVASRLANVAGDGRPFRCGGEEFAVVFPGKKAEEAVEYAEQLRQSIEQTAFMVRGPDRSLRRRDERRYRHSARHLHNQKVGTSVTVSIGLAQPRAAEDDVQKVIEAADKALYAAKERGRNRVVVATVGRRKNAAALAR